MRVLMAWGLLTGVILRRLARERLVIRSLVFPVALTVAALFLTVAVVVLSRSPPVVALAVGDADRELVQAIEARGWTVVAVADPEGWVRAGDAWAGFDGAQLWVYGFRSETIQIESILRAHLETSWRPDSNHRFGVQRDTRKSGRQLLQFLGALYVLYGVVFGAGMVARDRDEGTLEAEFALPVPRWIHGAARWVGGTALLSMFFLFAVVLLDAVLGVAEAASLGRNGVAALGSSTAIGLVVVGQASLKRGFAGPMSSGIGIVTLLMGLGLVTPAFADLLPVATLFSHQNGWFALLECGLVGGVAIVGFSWRSTRG